MPLRVIFQTSALKARSSMWWSCQKRIKQIWMTWRWHKVSCWQRVKMILTYSRRLTWMQCHCMTQLAMVNPPNMHRRKLGWQLMHQLLKDSQWWAKEAFNLVKESSRIIKQGSREILKALIQMRRTKSILTVPSSQLTSSNKATNMFPKMIRADNPRLLKESFFKSKRRIMKMNSTSSDQCKILQRLNFWLPHLMIWMILETWTMGRFTKTLATLLRRIQMRLQRTSRRYNLRTQDIEG